MNTTLNFDSNREILFLSSGKAKNFADNIRQILSDRIQNNALLRGEYDCLSWDNRRLFKKSHTTFDSLLDYAQWLRYSDGYAVCVLYPDDILFKDGDKNGKPYYVPRDNVIFELGLFYGTLGKGKTFFLCCDSANKKIVHNPSDLNGVMSFRYHWDNDANSPSKDAAKDLAVQLYDAIYDHLTISKIQNNTKEPVKNEESTEKMPILQNDINNEPEKKSKTSEPKESDFTHKIPTQSTPKEEGANEKASTPQSKKGHFPSPIIRGLDPK